MVLPILSFIDAIEWTVDYRRPCHPPLMERPFLKISDELLQFDERPMVFELTREQCTSRLYGGADE